jgi:hypothetical protein
MKIVSIFAIVDESLLSFKWQGHSADSFAITFEQWSDIIYLENFFEANIDDLKNGFWGETTVEKAIEHTLSEAEQFEKRIKAISKKGKQINEDELSNFIFKDLSRNDSTYTHVKSKAYGPTNPSWLRLYAIRLDVNLFFITGGAIKLTADMNSREHLKLELEKLEIAQVFLKEQGISNSDELGYLELNVEEKYD